MKAKPIKTGKANTYPNSCTMFALSALTDIPDEVIVKAFRATKCYAKKRGSDFFKTKKALNKLGVKYEDHFSDTDMAKQIIESALGGYLRPKTLLSDVKHLFKDNNHLVQVLVEGTPAPSGAPNSYHTIGVSNGRYINIEIDKLDRTWYLGHFTILGINGKKWMELIK